MKKVLLLIALSLTGGLLHAYTISINNQTGMDLRAKVDTGIKTVEKNIARDNSSKPLDIGGLCWIGVSVTGGGKTSGMVSKKNLGFNISCGSAKLIARMDNGKLTLKSE